MSRTSKILCTVCQSPAITQKTEKVHNEYSKLYCICTNQECQHKFVMNLEFSHTTRASLLDKDNLIVALISQFSEKDKEKLLTMLQKEKAPKIGASISETN